MISTKSVVEVQDNAEDCIRNAQEQCARLPQVCAFRIQSSALSCICSRQPPNRLVLALVDCVNRMTFPLFPVVRLNLCDARR